MSKLVEFRLLWIPNLKVTGCLARYMETDVRSRALGEIRRCCRALGQLYIGALCYNQLRLEEPHRIFSPIAPPSLT